MAAQTPRRRWKKIVLIGLGAIVLIVVALVALAPNIISSAAPARIEAAAARKIAGKVKITDLSLGWFSPTVIGPVQVIDPEGKTAATVTIESPATMWKVVSERWWRASKLDIGTAEVSGTLDLIRDTATGETNLQRALAPRAGAPGSSATTPSKPSSAPSTAQAPALQSIKAALNITSLEAVVRDRDAAGMLGQRIGVTGLKGPVNLEYVASPVTIIAAADLTGQPVGSSDALKLKVDANIKPKSGGGLESFVVRANLASAPVSLIDALAGQRGALLSALGPRADVTIDASGTPQAASAKMTLASEGAHANLDMALKDGVLTAAPSAGGVQANRLIVRSTDFVALLPSLRAQVAKAGEQVRLDKAPGVEISIDALRWPLPPELLASSTPGEALARVDFRGAAIDLKARVDAMSGQVGIPHTTDAGAPDILWRTFTTEPLALTIVAGDLAQPLTVSGGTRATIDGTPAGEVSIRATASGLLDAQGHLRAVAKSGLADAVDASVRVQGMSTALIQPIVAAINLPIDMAADIGPTLDLNMEAKADTASVSAPSAADLPPIAFTLDIASSNIKARGAGRLEKRVLSVTGPGLTASLNSGAPLARRILAKPGQPSSLELSGTGAMALTVKELAAPLDKLKGADALAAVKALLTIDISSLGVKPAGAPATEPPIQISKTGLTVRLDGANPPQMDIDAALSHGGSPFTLTGRMRLDGITGGKMPPLAAGPARVIAFKPTGALEVKNLPRSVLNLAPAAAAYGTGEIAADDMPSQITRAIRESIGRTATLTITTQPDGAAQAAGLKLTTEAGGVAADVAAKLTDKSVTVSTLQASLAMDPRTVNPVIAAGSGYPHSPSGVGLRGVGSDPTRSVGVPKAPMSLGQPFKITLASDGAMTVPLKAGTFEPDFAGASDASLKMVADGDIVIDNVPTGTDESGAARTTGVRVRGLKADVKAPLSGLAPNQLSKRLSANFAALAVRSGGGGGGGGGGEGATIADVSGSAQAGMDGSTPDVNLQLASIDTAVVENLIGKPGLLSGALGDKAEAVVRVQPQGGVQAISMTLTAPRVSDAKIELTRSADKIAISKPSTITWRPDPAFLNKMLFAPAASAGAQPGAAAMPSAVSVTQAAPITINIAKFAISSSRIENGRQVAGPLRPGVFELEASIDSPLIALSAAGPAGTDGKPGAATPITLDGLRGAVRHRGALGASGASGQAGFGEVVADLTIDRVSGGTGGATPAAGKSSTANIRIANLADARGVLTTDAAVINLDANLGAFPTQVIDSLARQKGILAELLGPTIDVQAKGRNLTRGAPSSSGAALANASGSLEFKATSPRATAQLAGELRSGVFVQTGPTDVRLTIITTTLVKQLAGAVPIVESLEKFAGDEPAKLDTRSLSIPLDGDLTKLSGEIDISPGVARFTTKSIFGTLIESFGGNKEGALGRRIEPFKVRADKGVLTYDRFKLPVGQFFVETRGTVDLVRRQIDIVTYAPIGALTSKALGDLDTGIAGKLGLLDKTTGVPIVSKGPLDNHSTNIDFGLFLKEQGDKLLKDPGKLIGVIGDLLGGGKKPAETTPAPAPSPATPVAPKQPSSAPPQQPAPTPAPAPAPKTDPKPAAPGTQPPANPPASPPANPPAEPKPKPKPKPKPAEPTPAPAPKP